MRSFILTLCTVLAFADHTLAAPKADFPIRQYRPASVGACGRLVVDGYRVEKMEVARRSEGIDKHPNAVGGQMRSTMIRGAKGAP